MSQQLCYPLFHGYLDRWLVSRVTETPLHSKPVALTGEENMRINGFPRDNPGKDAFTASRRAAPLALPRQLDARPGGLVGDASPQPFAIYWPFDDIGVTFAMDCETPTCLSAWAFTRLDCRQAGPVPFDLITCGSAAVWCNGQKVCEVTPYHHNDPVPTPISLDLRQGLNSLLVYFDNYAERDAAIILRLRWKGEGEPPVQCLPVGDADAGALAEAERLMRSLSFRRNHFTAGDVVLDHAPVTRPWQLTLEGGTEENLKGGVPFRCEARVQPGRTWVSLGDCGSFPLGFLFLKASVRCGDVALTKGISVEINTRALLPDAAPTTARRKRQALELLARYGEQNTNRALALLATGGSVAEAEKLLAVQSEYIRRRFDCSDFYLVYYPYIIKRYGDVLSPAVRQELEDCVIGFRYWLDEPGNDAMWFWSENHALMFHTCQLLAGELYPDRVFTNSGMTGVQMQEKAKRLLREWFVTFRREGFTEWNSSPYLPIDTLGFGSLYAFAQDPEMRALGKEGLDFACYIMAVHAHKGMLAGSSGRTYIKEQFGNWSNCPTGFSRIVFGNGLPGHAGKGIVSLCLSDYEAPAELRQWVEVAPGQELICQTTQGNDGYVDLYTYRTSDYMMTSAASFHAGKPGHQENPFQLTFTGAAQLWITHPGEWVQLGAARPSYWAGNGTLPQVQQYKGFAALLYDLAPEHPVDMTHLYLPAMEFDQVVREPHWAFARLGGAYAAVYCSRPMEWVEHGPGANREAIAQGRRCLWLVRAAQSDEFAGFDAFVQAIKTAPLRVGDLSFTFDDPAYGTLHSAWKEALCVNGTPMQYSGFDRYGKLTLQNKA
ncbi:hypothetical protein MR942_10650 [bacterium]|nr:hypothetical protein [bacterium]